MKLLFCQREREREGLSCFSQQTSALAFDIQLRFSCVFCLLPTVSAAAYAQHFVLGSVYTLPRQLMPLVQVVGLAPRAFQNMWYTTTHCTSPVRRSVCKHGCDVIDWAWRKTFLQARSLLIQRTRHTKVKPSRCKAADAAS